MLRTIGLTISLLLPAPTAVAGADGCEPAPPDSLGAAIARTDHQVSGNRVSRGCGPLTGDVVDVELGGTPAWVLPDPSDRGTSWFVVLDDGSVDHVIAEDGLLPYVSQSETPPLAPGEPPLAVALTEDQLVVGSALGAAGWFRDPLPDTRVVETPGQALIALTGPTDRYSHGVLGDGLEASAITLRDVAGVTSIDAGDVDVIEGTSALLADLRGDVRSPEIVVTVSNADSGARLVAYDLDGEFVAASEPIGQGYRWLHQVGAGPLGPDGETEIIVVRTPHIGGIVEAYRLVDDRLQLVASQPGYSSHQLGSSNLDMALLADADGDGHLDVVVPRQAMNELAVLARIDDGFEEIDALPLEGALTTNVAATPDADGNLVLAAGTDDGRLRIFR